MSMAKRVVLVVLALAALCLAQDVRTGTLVGLVTDATGAAVANAQVDVVNVQTKVETHAKTTSDGNYYLPFLNLGEYEVTVEVSGFKKYVRTGIILQAGSTMRIDVPLEVGASNQQIEVTATSPLLVTDSAVVGSSSDAKKVQETPINESRPTFAMYYMEGTSCGSGSCTVLGSSSNYIDFTIDGAQSKQSVRSPVAEANTMVTVPIDAIAEAQVWSTGTPAEKGHTAGGAFNVVTSGGTELHFAAEERYINKDFIDRAYFQQSVANLSSAGFEYHNFDADLGGPVYIPKVYDGRNKTFFFLGFRFDYDHEANSSTTSTVDQGMLGGNFSFGGLGYPIYDPEKHQVHGGGRLPLVPPGWTATTPFSGNQIPVKTRFDGRLRPSFSPPLTRMRSPTPPGFTAQQALTTI